MTKPFQIHIFGKQDCKKCGLLHQRLDKLLASDDGHDFTKLYSDVETEDGIIAFCQAECINPQRIPAFLVEQLDPATDRYQPIPNPGAGEPDPVCGASKLYLYLGLQTDYSEAGGGLITPQMIKACMAEARAAARKGRGEVA